MFTFLSDFLQKKQIDCFAPLPLSACPLVRPYLLEREGISDGTVILMAIPYFSSACAEKERNISAYATAKDYHSFFAELFEELLPALRKKFPENRFAGFADHSPIAEVTAAAHAGLGIIGKNQLLITPKYSSYVFLGEIITDASLPCEKKELQFCEDCGACQRNCPATQHSGCLSALTQKKGTLTAQETATLQKHGFAWGCDLCQEICPHTRLAIKNGTIYSPIPYFSQDTVSYLTTEALDAMTEKSFLSRAYAWRGRETIRRNLLLMETSYEKGDTKC